MKLYAVKEYDLDVFVTKNVVMAVHEMLSLIHLRLKYCSESPANTVSLKDIYIEEFYDEENSGKRHRFVTDFYTFNLQDYTVISRNYISNKKLEKAMSKCSNKMTELIKWFTSDRKTSNVNHYNNNNAMQCPNAKDVVDLTKSVDILTSMVNTVPLINNRNSTDNVTDNIESVENIEEKLTQLEEEINNLQKIKTQGNEKIHELRDVQDSQLEDLVNYSCDMNYEKKKLFIEKDREQERRRMFNADKKAYLLMKGDIENGKLDPKKISPLFSDKYPIFEFMDERDMLTEIFDEMDRDQVGKDYFIYSQLTIKENPSMKSKDADYIPHNYNYLNDEEREKFASSIDKNQDVIEEFMNKQKNLRPLSEILDDLDLGSDSDTSDDGNNIEENISTICHGKRSSSESDDGSESDSEFPEIKSFTVSSNSTTADGEDDENEDVEDIKANDEADDDDEGSLDLTGYNYDKIKQIVNKVKHELH